MRHSFSQARARARGADGFTLVELILVMLIIVVLAGVTLPVASKIFDREASKATRGEMKNLAAAVEMYFADTFALPANVNSLILDPGVAGWAGPYISGGVQSAGAASGDFDMDGWSVAYRLTITGDIWTLESGGSDRAVGGADDLVMAVDVTPIRRDATVDRLGDINLAVQLYNEDWLSPPSPATPDPLSDSWPVAQTQLVGRGYLSNDPDYNTDAWGDDFVRSGTSGPVYTFESQNIGP